METVKFDWKRQEKQFYSPKALPEIINIPAFNFFTIQGNGNPNDPFFGEYISVLYSLSYGVKMSPRSGKGPEGYFEYSVYPLEGVWDLDENGRKNYNGTVDKNSLVFTLMIRQPDFVTEPFAAEIIARTKIKKPHPLLEIVKFGSIEEGSCIQMLHTGHYDSEPESFKKMEQFAFEKGFERKSMVHREIYLSDARKTAPDKLRTILRFQV